MINNTPEIKLGIVAVSRDCFPNSLSENRRKSSRKKHTTEKSTNVQINRRE